MPREIEISVPVISRVTYYLTTDRTDKQIVEDIKKAGNNPAGLSDKHYRNDEIIEEIDCEEHDPRFDTIVKNDDGLIIYEDNK